MVKQTQKKKRFNKLNCAPSKKNKLKFTCYEIRDIYNFKEMWNKSNPNDKITSKEPYTIWKKLKRKLLNVCTNERCWLAQKFLDNNYNKKLISKLFAPKMPNTWLENINTWLSSMDIIKLMDQYEKSYKNFKFIGPSPIDFDTKINGGNCVWQDLCNLNLYDCYKKNIYKIGIILNLDTHDKGGSHWVANFIDLKNKYIFYFDSNGVDIPKPVKILNERLIKDYETDSKIKLKHYVNRLQHQYKDGTCGIYALYVLINLLTEQLKPLHIMKNKIPDLLMQNMRFIYYNKN
tara:strand:- start:1325 stop:2194 length:870 start_codon:yes stop_codon:yes gene_type:complete